jgi:DNA methylase
MDKRASFLFDVSDSAQAALIEGARDVQPVSGLTHNFYRYPARFSPTFVRAVIEAFTERGDYLLDPYFGGGTSLVEAVALGRNAIGVDISEIAELVATVKTTVLSESELQDLAEWAAELPKRIHIHRSSPRFDDYAKRGYYKHLDHPSRWRLRKAIERALGSVLRLHSPQTPQMEAFARCVVLRTAQAALDGRLKLPSIATFREMLSESASDGMSGRGAKIAPFANVRYCVLSLSNLTRTEGKEEEVLIDKIVPSPNVSKNRHEQFRRE